MVDKNVPTEPPLQPSSEKEIKPTFGNKIKIIREITLRNYIKYKDVYTRIHTWRRMHKPYN